MGALGRNIDNLAALFSSDFARQSERFRGVTVSCSGHLDSTVLFEVIFRNQKLWRFPLSAILHFNFGLRESDSDADERLVRRMSAEAGVDFLCFRFSPTFAEKSGQSIQEWARNERLKVYRLLAKQGQIIALAHHLDDQAETTIFRIARGTSSSQMLGMQRLDGNIWRPFLHLSKSELVEFAKQHALAHRFDCSNDTMEYSRNRIRRSVMPVLQEMYSNALQHIVNCASDAEQLGRFCRDQIEASVQNIAINVVEIPYKWFDSNVYEDAIALIAAEVALQRLSVEIAKSRRTFSQLVDLIRSLPERGNVPLRATNKAYIVRNGALLRFESPQLLAQKSDRLAQCRSSFKQDEVQIVADSGLIIVKKIDSHVLWSCQNSLERRQFPVIPQ